MTLEGGIATNSVPVNTNAFATLGDDSGSKGGGDPMAAEPSPNTTTTAAGQHISDSHGLFHELSATQ